jgi:hypothetical protein
VRRLIQTKIIWEFSIGLLLVASAQAEVRVFIQDTNGVALIKYECTAGEIVRAFALDVTVDQSQIIGVSDFLRGPSTAEAPGYGIFPASFRDHFSATGGTNIDWTLSDYTPLANVADNPGDTLPGLNSGGVTLEFGALWDSTVSGAMPGPTGTLCALHLSRSAKVSVSANAIRGGIVSAFPENPITSVFIAALVGPAVTSATMQNGVMTILFHGGELETANTVEGPWTSSGDRSGTLNELVGTNQARFYRVHGP